MAKVQTGTGAAPGLPVASSGTSTAPAQTTQNRSWVVLGLGVVGLILLGSTHAFGGVVVALLIAGLIYQALHGDAVASFVNYLTGNS